VLGETRCLPGKGNVLTRDSTRPWSNTGTIRHMTISSRELLTQYGIVALRGNAAIFVGAGLSISAGYPAWSKLLEQLRSQAEVPSTITDLPLMAEYIEQSIPGGRDALESHLLLALAAVDGHPSQGHRWLSELPIDDIWTTNYDTLLEQSIPGISIVSSDENLQDRRRLQRRRVIKMHGSLTMGVPPRWLIPPVITRQDYEEYDIRNPRLWADLRATYLTKSILFLGFSFTDPNIEVLLRLSRTLHIGAPEHFTILRAPPTPEEKRLHDLQVRDLERSGIAVCEVADFNELEPFLRSLVRRTCRKVLFISGSTSGDSDINECSNALGYRLAEWNIELTSLAGNSAMILSYGFGKALIAENRYDPDRVRFYFRKSPNRPPPLTDRIGTAIYSGMSKEDLCEWVLAKCRAMIIIGGGDNTKAEFDTARKLGVPVIPLARSGGVAKVIWQETTPADSGIALEDTESETRDWELLNNENVEIAVSAAIRLVSQTMFLNPDEDRFVTGRE